MLILMWLSILALGYVYAGYPLLLRLILAVRGPRPILRGDITPTVSVVISAYNEAAVIGQKLANALELDYPRSRLEIVVASDASTDDTDQIVAGFADRGVRLIRQSVRRGKTAGLNHAVPQLGGEILVFSDANALYRPDAIRKLVRNFADPDVGCVTGEARYVKSRRETAAQLGERAYWDYEIQQKRLETAVGSMVGGDGAIYAIRAALWRPLPETAINDFLNPLQIVEAGWRAVYEPEAICFEETAGGAAREYSRRVRIVSRSWRAVFQARGVLNPFKVGFFTLSVVSHKMLRWWSGLFASIIVIALATRAVDILAGLPPAASASLAAAMAVLLLLRPARRLLTLTLYFAVINAASLVGIAKGSLGRVSGTWRPPRIPHATAHGWVPLADWLMLAAGFLLLAALAVASPRGVVEVVFWASVAGLFYVYIAYPLLMAALAAAVGRRVARSEFEPSIALLIIANDEARVIEAKIQNSLSLDYPRHRYRIVVASDGSVDGTNQIVRSHARDGIELIAFPERRGKMAAINSAVEAIGPVDVLVFSDANVFLQPGALRELVANLADPRVGGVSGDVVLVGDRAALASSEDLYYRYERWLQRAESSVGSMIGVDGAMYAIRRSLFAPQSPDTILDDMAIPMAIIKQGYRVVFEPSAIAVEQGSQSAWEEFARKTRVVAGAAQFLLRAPELRVRQPQVLFSFFSHKVLRWLSPVASIATLVCSVVLSAVSVAYLAVAIGQSLVFALGIAGCAPRLRRLRFVGLAHYCCLVQAAAALGLLRGLLGRQPSAWQRFARAPVEEPAPVALPQTGEAL